MYKPVIRYEKNGSPYLYCSLTRLPEKVQLEIQDGVIKTIDSYMGTQQQKELWQRRADALNLEWRLRKGDETK
jgi:hypothetical protein